ncbi:MAG TPA: hypothetical protein VFZ08_03990 [Terriglobia bacterium]|nr:hypothetical protein [Terriglobia bacterium]
MKSKALLLILIVIALSGTLARAQTDADDIEPILKQQLQSPKVVTFQLQQFLQQRVPKLQVPSSAEAWTAEAQQIRRRILQDVVFHGWPSGWINSPPHFEDEGTIASGHGYELHKLRYEVVPGFYAAALLYEPDHLSGKAPAVLNVMGHFGELGNTVEFEQKFCINQALRGVIALNPDWFGMGEMNVPGNEHWFSAHLDLVGLNGLGLFYLATRRGLDYLAKDPNVDPGRIGATGLSGGGWQTIMISSLDPRVLVSIPVAGYTTLPGRIERLPGEPGDLEQNATDFLVGHGYSTLTAMRAPRPTLLIYNAEDNCCFRAPLVKPYVFDAIKPFFGLYGKEDAFQFHQNTNVSAHNYGLDNRDQAYRFFAQYLHLQNGGAEIPVGQYVKSYDELQVGLPKDNLTILGLARKIASGLTRPAAPAGQAEMAAWSRSQRSKLREVVRYHAVNVSNAWEEHDTNHNQVESISYRFEFNNGLGATGVWLKEVSTPTHAPMTIVLNDGGRKAAATEHWDRIPEVADRMERGEQVLVANLLFTGDAAPALPSYLITQMIAATGERPLGMEAAQLISLAQWAQHKWNSPSVRIETSGIRTQVISLVAAALESHRFSAIENYGGMHSLGYLLDKPVKYEDAPDLFCLDLYKDFDIDSLTALASPTQVSETHDVHTPPKNAQP